MDGAQRKTSFSSELQRNKEGPRLRKLSSVARNRKDSRSRIPVHVPTQRTSLVSNDNQCESSVPHCKSVQLPPLQITPLKPAAQFKERHISLPCDLQPSSVQETRRRNGICYQSRDQRLKEQPKRRLSEIERINCQTSSMQNMMEKLEEQVYKEGLATDSISTFLPQLTPEPAYVKEYGRNPDGGSPDDLGYKPKRCWCNRCQIMYRMHRDKDFTLTQWGNYPCHQW